MIARSDVYLVLPGEERNWELWRTGEKRCRSAGLERLADLPAGINKVVVGLPAHDCTSFAVSLPQVDSALLEEMAFSQLEKRGLSAGGRERTVFAYHRLHQGDGGLVLGIDVLPEDFSEDLRVDRAVRYTPASRLFRLPDQKLVLTREQGSYVLLAGLHGKLAFSQVITAGGEVSPAFVQEINLALISLEASGVLHEITGIELWVDFEEAQLAMLQEALTLPLESTARPKPGLKAAEEASDRMLPETVIKEQGRKRKMQRIRVGILALCAFYVLLAVLLAIQNQRQGERAVQLEDLIASRRDRVQFIQESMTRRRALEAAYDKRFYPAIQLNGVTRLMPPSGVVIQKFVTQGQSVRLEGLARDPQLAFQLKEDLEKAPGFAGYSWDMAPPRMNQNNSAAFRLEGKYAGSN